MENIIIAIIQVIGTIAVAIFTYLANHKMQKISDIKEELRKELKAQHEETLQKIAELENTTDSNDIDTVRSRIVAFENLCRMDKNYNTLKRHQFDTIFKDVDKWAKYHEKYPNLNGEIDVAIESIKEHFKKEIF